MPSKKDNQKFAEFLVEGTTLLDAAIEWVKDNMKPDDVFDNTDLSTWAEDNGFVKEEE